MYDPGKNARGAQSRDGFGKCFFLLLGLARAKIFGGGEVGVRSAEHKVRASCQGARKRLDFSRRDAETIHSRLDFQMEADFRAWAAAATVRCGALQHGKLFNTRDGGR
jgi:hypothetical protein